MSRFKIYNPQGGFIAEGCPRFMSNFGQPDCLEFPTISSDVPLDFPFGSYVDYFTDAWGRSGQYYLYDIPQPTKQARRGESGESFVYSNVRFYLQSKELERTLFRDIVEADNGIHFSSRETISTYEDVEGIARRIEACMNARETEMHPDYPDTWEVRVYATEDASLQSLLKEVKEFTINAGATCLDALNEIYNVWKGIGWVYNYTIGRHTITLGRPNIQDGDNTTDLFRYGRGKGLTSLRRSLSSAEEFANRLYVFGSTRNLISRYYNTKDILNAESVDIPHLMLPVERWGETGNLPDASKAFVENGASVAKYGDIAKVIYFDGSGDYPEIYPSIEGALISDIRSGMSPEDQYFPSYAEYDGNERADEIKDASEIIDDGIYMDNSDGTVVINTGTKSGFNYGTGITVPMGRMSAIEYELPVNVIGNLTKRGQVEVKSYNWSYYYNIPSVVGINSVKATIKMLVGDEIIYSKDVECSQQRNTLMVTLPSTMTGTYTQAGQLKVAIRIWGTVTADTQSGLTLNASSNPSFEYRSTIKLADTFTVRIKQIGFNIANQASTSGEGIGTLAMKTGMCAGREFSIKSCTYNADSDDWVLTCYRQNDTTLAQYFPNYVYAVAPEDRFVLTDIIMPVNYITLAENRLFNEANRLLETMSKPKYVYEPQVDSIYQNGARETLCAGLYMAVEDSDVIEGNMDFVLMDSVTISHNEGALPTIKVTLRDEKASNFFQKITKAQNQSRQAISSVARRFTDVSTSPVTKGDGGYELPSLEGVTSVSVRSDSEGLYAHGSPINSAGTISIGFEEGFSLMTAAEKTKLANAAEKSEIPTRMTQLSNDGGYLTHTEGDRKYAFKGEGGVDMSDAPFLSIREGVIECYHPGMNMDGASLVLMRYGKCNGYVVSKDEWRTEKKRWFRAACGNVGYDTSAFTFEQFTPLRSLQAFIFEKYTYELMPGWQSNVFRGKQKYRKTFGVALRYKNPKWSDTWTERYHHVEDDERIQKYIYSKVAVMKVHIMHDDIYGNHIGVCIK